VGTRNLQRLLARHVRPGASFLELGCAPGKMLAWVASELGAVVAGLDYSETGFAWSRALFSRLGLPGDLRCEDVFATTFPTDSFDVVFSAGLIEHFEDPREIVRIHVRLLRPGGTALITVPNYSGVYGRLQRFFDPENLAIHNLAIMELDALSRLAPTDLTEDVRVYADGSLSPWLVNFGRKWPMPFALFGAYLLNAVGILQPVRVPALCPLLVLEISRKGVSR